MSPRLNRAALGRAALAAAVLTGLAGCGYNQGDRALSGGGIGAAGGALLGAATGGNPLTGALIGGGVGAATGALTSPNAINLGRGPLE